MPAFLEPSRLSRALGPLAPLILRFASSRPGLVLAGGPVRDAVMGRPVADVDITVEKGGAAAVGRAFADMAGGALVLLGKERLARVIRGAATVDFTPLRAPTLEADLRARDFTVNAMAVRLPWGAGRAEVIDPTGGISDLKARRLRACSASSFRDDPVRLWRAIRMEAELRFRPEAATARLLAAAIARKPALPGERLRDEFMKLLALPNAAGALARARKAGLLGLTFPETRAMDAVKAGRQRIDVMEHTLDGFRFLEMDLASLARVFPREGAAVRAHLDREAVAGRPRSSLLKLAMLLHDVGKPGTVSVREDGRVHFLEHEKTGAATAANVMRNRLKMAEGEVRSVTALIRQHLRIGFLAGAPRVTDRAVYRLIRDAGDELFDLVLHARADRRATRHGLRISAAAHARMVGRILGLRRAMLARQDVRRLLTGHDVMKELGIGPGPVVGAVLRAVDEAAALGQVRDRAGALREARRALEGARRALEGARQALVRARRASGRAGPLDRANPRVLK